MYESDTTSEVERYFRLIADGIFEAREAVDFSFYSLARESDASVVQALIARLIQQFPCELREWAEYVETHSVGVRHMTPYNDPHLIYSCCKNESGEVTCEQEIAFVQKMRANVSELATTVRQILSGVTVPDAPSASTDDIRRREMIPRLADLIHHNLDLFPEHPPSLINMILERLLDYYPTDDAIRDIITRLPSDVTESLRALVGRIPRDEYMWGPFGLPAIQLTIEEQATLKRIDNVLQDYR